MLRGFKNFLMRGDVVVVAETEALVRRDGAEMLRRPDIPFGFKWRDLFFGQSLHRIRRIQALLDEHEDAKWIHKATRWWPSCR